MNKGKLNNNQARKFKLNQKTFIGEKMKTQILKYLIQIKNKKFQFAELENQKKIHFHYLMHLSDFKLKQM